MAIDFVKFAVDAIKIIDEIRSTNADPKNINSNSAKPTESRINTFYRAIGLPAFTTNKTTQNKQLNNGNLHETDPEDPDVKVKLNATNERERQFSIELTEEAQKAFLDNIEETVLSSIKRFNESGDRKKGGLFPMIVNGNIKIYPQDRRVGGAFFKKNSQLVVNHATYRRPLMETIVLLRLRSKGFINSTDSAKLQSDFGGVEITVDGKKTTLSDTGFFDGSGENILTLEIIRSLLGAVIDPDGIAKIIDLTVEKLGRVRKQVRESFKDSKEATVAEEQPVAGESDGQGQFEKQKEERDRLKSEDAARITLLEFDDTFSLGSDATKNMKDAMFAPMVLDTILADTTEIDKTIKEGEEKKKNLDRLHKRLNKNMDLILGAYSGISGIDILVIITALFSIDIEDLLGLLNKESIKRLAILKSTTVEKLPSRTEKVFIAIDNLEKKTEEIFKILDIKVKIVSLKEKKAKNEA